MTSNCKINEMTLSNEEVVKLMNELNRRNIEIEDNCIYIFPECTEPSDIINEFAPDFMKLAKLNNIQCKLIYNENNYSYLSLRDSEILLPIIIGAAGSLLSELIKHYLLKLPNTSSKIKVRMITKKKSNSPYSKIEISGDASSVLEALRMVKDVGEDKDEI